MRLLKLVAGLALLAFAPVAMAETKPFVHKGISKDAERYEAYLKTGFKAPQKKPLELRIAADRAMATDPRGASRLYAVAVAADDKSAEGWLGLARALLAIKPDENKGSEKYDLPVNASGAAYRAYERATDTVSKARALYVLGDAMQRRSYWRPAIDALKQSLELVEAADVRDAYEKLRVEHGFRMTDYRIDSDISSPRLCVQFSENLGRGQIDFAKFISVDGKDPQSVLPEGQQLCIEGLVHGQRYEVQLRQGLPSDVGEALEKPANIAVYVPDRKPFVSFAGKSYVLPSRGQQGIPVVTVNTGKVALEVYRVGDRNLSSVLGNGDFERQLSTYDLETLKDRTGALVYQGEMDVASKLNEEVTTAFPVSDALGQMKPGAYVVIARASDHEEDSYNGLATQWFIVSDLGLTAFSGADGIHAFVRSLAGTDPVKEANVRLVARNNEVLATAKTDANGYARFEAGLAKGEGGAQPAILIAENASGEYAFLDLTAGAFDLSDRGVEGRDAPGPLDGYLYTERGVYRPGEEVNFTAIVRDAAGVAATLPATLIVTRPDGVEHARYALSDQGLGGRTQRLALGSDVMTGTWRAKLHADPKDDPITQVTFLVEDYVPERLDLTLEPGAGSLAPEETKSITLSGRYLYGPPAAGLAVEGDIVVKAAQKGVEGYPGFEFGQAEEVVNPTRQALEGLPQTGDDGKAVLSVSLPAVQKTVRPLEADVIVRLREPGGRAIERSITLPVDMKEPRIGLKPVFDKKALGEGEKASFEVVLLDENGKPAATSLTWELVRLDTSWQWYSRDGVWSYEAQTITRKVGTGQVTTTADAPAKITADVDYGRYRLEVTAPEYAGALTSVAFNAGWYVGEETANSPEVLDVALDKAKYAPGDTAKLRIASKQGGKALVAVLGSSLLTMKEVDIPKGGGDVEIAVGSDWGPGAYATALLYRAMDEKAKRMPSRAIGVKWIDIDQTGRTLKVALPTEARIKSGGLLTVPVKIDGLTSGEEARVTVAAVDVGILNLTRYQVPAPELHFYAQRKLGLEIRDFYGRLIDGMRAERGTMRQGGDGSEGAGIEGSPPVEDTVAFYSGIVKVGADGTANAEFQMPDFNGTVRVMAVAWSKDKVGHGTSDVIVRDPVALTASGPRFLTLGDEARLDLSVHNVDGTDGAYKVSVGLEPVEGLEGKMVEVSGNSIALKNGERKSDRITVKPAEVGLHTYGVNVTGPGGIDVKRRLTFDVKPPAGDIRRTTMSQVAGKGGKLTLSKDLLAGLIASRSRVNVSVGPAARFDVAGLLSQLDRYPYGCAEQTTSRALPLLYANEVAAAAGLAPDKELKDRVQKAVDRVFEMQDSSGAFGVWGPTDGDLWLTAYVTDFLTRAKGLGYDVRTVAFNQALDRLQNFAINNEEVEKNAPARAYALYVLARNGRAPIGELRYYSDTRLDKFSTPLAKAQLGAALAMMGDKERAETAWRAAVADYEQPDALAQQSYYRADYGSLIRDGAALVTLAAESKIATTATPRLVDVIAKAYQSRQYTSTQEQAWLLLAANALSEQSKDMNLQLGGTPVKGSVIRSLSAEELEKGIVITNAGESPTDAVVTVIGASLTPEPAVMNRGFRIERSFYTLDGTPVDFKSATGGVSEVKQNDRFVAVVKVESDEKEGRVLLVDRLPAGFEIENPRIVDSGDVKTLDWLKSDFQPAHTEFRDDRFVAAFHLSGGAPVAEQVDSGNDADGNENDTAGDQPNVATPDANAAAKPGATAIVAYIVRAVTPGAFLHPAATVEDMYRPERYGRTAAGKLTVKAE